MIQGQSVPFLTGGGAMSELIRSYDWSQTSLGALSNWPQPLVTTLRLILPAKLPMFLVWGPDQICFYNDAFRPVLASTATQSFRLGMPAQQAWAAMWDTIQPLIDQVVNTGEAIWQENQLIPVYRNHKFDDANWAYSFSPVYAEDGQLAGVFGSFAETTAPVQALTNQPLPTEQSPVSVPEPGDPAVRQAEEKQIEAQRGQAENERQLRLIIHQAPTAIAIFRGPSFVVDIVNAHALDLWGRQEADVIDKPILEVIPELIQQGIKDILDSVFETGKSFSATELPVRLRRNGHLETVFVNFVYEPLYDANGIINGIMTVGTNVTTQVTGRKKIEENEELLRIALEGGELGTFDFYPATGQLIWSAKTKEFFGLPAEADINYSVYMQGLHPEDKGSSQSIAQQQIQLQNGGLYELEYRTIGLTDGKLRWIRSKGKATYNAEGKPIRYTGVTQDITERKKVEDDLKRFKFMADNASVPFILIRADGTFEYLNKQALEKWGYSADEAQQLSVPDIDPVYPIDSFNEVFSNAQRETIPPFETIHRKKDGTTYHVEISMSGFVIGNTPYAFAVERDITDSKQAADALKESEQRIRTLIENAPFPIGVYVGCEMRIQFANQAIIDVWGKGNDVIGKLYTDILPELENQAVFEQLNSVFTTGIPFHAKNQHVDLLVDGQLKRYYFNYSFTPLFDTDGQVYGVMNTGADVTDIATAKQRIEENEERLNIVVDASELGTWDLNLKTQELYYSPRYREIFGYEENARLQHTDFINRLHADDLPIRDKAYENAIVTSILHYESRLIRPDHAVRWIDVKGKIFYDETGRPAKLIGTVRDITDEKTYQRELEEREQKFRLLADSMPQQVWTADAQGELNYFNKSVFDYAGLSPAQADASRWIQIVHPDDRAENIRRWTISIETGADFLFEHRFRRHDGTYRWHVSQAIAQRDPTGTIQMWVGTSTDIQDQKTFTNELERQVQERTAELEQKNRELGKINKELQSFAYVSSHDLQEPLRKIQTFASLILEKEQQNLSEIGQHGFSRIQQAAARMQQLIQDLLAYSRTTSAEKNFIATDLTKIIQQVLDDLSEEIQKKKAVIDLGELCFVPIIPFQFHQLMYNLISNSLKFSKPDQAPCIRIKAEIKNNNLLPNEKVAPAPAYCHIHYEDNGIGFEPQFNEKIFELFQRLHGKSDYNGTGIGLSIVKKIIENHKKLFELMPNSS